MGVLIVASVLKGERAFVVEFPLLAVAQGNVYVGNVVLAVAQGNVYVGNVAFAGNLLKAEVSCGGNRQGFPHLIPYDRIVVPAEVDGDVVIVVVPDRAEEAGVELVKRGKRLRDIYLLAQVAVIEHHAEMLRAVREVHFIVSDNSGRVIDPEA